jgi:hypothetical protein
MMFLRRLAFGLFCLAAVGYVAWANMHGYVPFVANDVNATRAAPAHFHK